MVGTSWRYSPLIDCTNAVLCCCQESKEATTEVSIHLAHGNIRCLLLFQILLNFLPHIDTTFQSRWTESEILLFVLAQPVEQRHIRLLNLLVLFDASFLQCNDTVCLDFLRHLPGVDVHLLVQWGLLWDEIQP